MHMLRKGIHTIDDCSVNQYSHTRNKMAFPQKTKDAAVMQSKISTTGSIPRRNEINL